MAEIVGSLPDYNSSQQVYCISAASNAAGLKKDTTENLETGFKEVLDEILPQLTPVKEWQTAWGPAVFKKQPNNPDTPPLNAWFVAQNDHDKVLVVAIAGTAAESKAAWLGDINVGQVVNFDKWTADWTVNNIPSPHDAFLKNAAMVSRGTCEFVHHILTTPSPLAAKGTLLAAFLQSFQKEHSDYSIIFTGHSLGGAVSPTLALGLVQSKILKSDNINTMPSAGASPGNQNFDTNFSNTFTPGGGFNFNFFNNLDIVPQAWSLVATADRKISNIKTIYATATGDAADRINTMVSLATPLSAAGTKYLGLPGAAFTGPPIPTGISEKQDLTDQLVFQHTKAYWAKLGITDFVDLFSDALKGPLGEESAVEFEVVDDDEFASIFEAAQKRAQESTQAGAE